MAYTKLGYWDSTGSVNPLKINPDGSIDVNTIIGSVLLETTDIQIGAVEIKDDDTGSRLDILSAGTPSTYFGVEVVNPLPAGTNILGSVITTVNATLGSTYLVDSSTGSALDIVVTGTPTAYLGTEVVNPLPAGDNIIGSVVTTVNVGSVYVSNIETGTIATLTSVTNIAAGSIQLQPGTDEVGSVHVTNLDGGVVDTVTSVTNIVAGSVQLQPSTDEVGSVHVTSIDGGTVDTVSAITSLTAGSVQLQDGIALIGSIISFIRDESTGSQLSVNSSGVPTNYVGTRLVSGVDSATNAIETIDYSHHEVHAGSHFYIGSYSDDIDTNGSVVFCVLTPDTTTWAHMTFSIDSATTTTVEVWEAGSCTGGTSATPYNNDRNSSYASVLSVSFNPTINSHGSLIDSAKYGTDGIGTNTGFGGTVNRDRETILKQNTVYVYKIISNADNNIISYRGDWYEHVNN
jgi:hypothetical protein